MIIILNYKIVDTFSTSYTYNDENYDSSSYVTNIIKYFLFMVNILYGPYIDNTSYYFSILAYTWLKINCKFILNYI